MINIKANENNELKYELELKKKKDEEKIIKESKDKEESIEYFTE